MEMTKTHDENAPAQYDLDTAAQAVSAILDAGGHRHAYIGGFAVSQLGGLRYTQDIDVIVDRPAEEICSELLAANDNFVMSGAYQLKYRNRGHAASGTKDVVVELLQGGAQQQLKLPDLSTTPVYPTENGEPSTDHPSNGTRYHESESVATYRGLNATEKY
ncbi:MAG: hypothetical protein M1819_002117 [Sarea resinae]|nr:MAG: hypothetical protein M1819_002117 [Sarea resinae]